MPLSREEQEVARILDDRDPLREFRRHFVHSDPDLIYLDGNSLGRLPAATIPMLQQVVTVEWGEGLIRSWNQSWLQRSRRVAAQLASLIGADADEVVVADSTSVNLFKLAAAALDHLPGRTTLISDALNFPSDLYILQGLVRWMNRGHRLVVIPSADDLTMRTQDFEALLDSDTALVCLSHAAYKSAFLHDLEETTARVHACGGMMLWDLSHSVGAMPIDLHRAGADLAVGCTYKYLNGGPGAPAFLYVRRELQPLLTSPIQGWFGARQPFDFQPDYEAAEGVQRFAAGTPSMLSLSALEPALTLIQEAGLQRIRDKSLMMSERLIDLIDRRLTSLGFVLGSPREPARRGSHVSLRHPEAWRVCQALIHPRPDRPVLIPDFRRPDHLRLGLQPLYNTFAEIHLAVDRLREIVSTAEYECHDADRRGVT